MKQHRRKNEKGENGLRKWDIKNIENLGSKNKKIGLRKNNVALRKESVLWRKENVGLRK